MRNHLDNCSFQLHHLVHQLEINKDDKDDKYNKDDKSPSQSPFSTSPPRVSVGSQYRPCQVIAENYQAFDGQSDDSLVNQMLQATFDDLIC